MWTRSDKHSWTCSTCGEVEQAYNPSILQSLMELHETKHRLQENRRSIIEATPDVKAFCRDTLRLSVSDRAMFKEMGILYES